MKKNAKRWFSLCLSMVLALALLPVTALADESTTTLSSAHKDLNPRTEIYAVTSAPGSDYPSYGAKWEPQGGVYYGRIARGGTLSNGQYGLANRTALSKESILSYYYNIYDSYPLEYWSYLYGDLLTDGSHAFLVNLNFPYEGSDCDTILAGGWDGKLVQDLSYLGTLPCPVFLRIGGEVNVWTTTPDPARYIAAYQHIAALARTYSPNVALVFSPNFSGGWKIDMDSYYPGDAYVDWIGVSLYYNRYSHTGGNLTEADEIFMGVGSYGDPMLNVQQTVNLGALHNKPIIVTEGGSINEYSGSDNSAWASERLKKAYSFLPMVYPQIKAMVYSDTDFGVPSQDYTIYDNPAMTAAYEAAVNANPTLLHSCQGTASYYTKLSAYPSQWSGVMQLAAYTYAANPLTATWYVDGAAVATAADYPYRCTLDTGSLAPGSHTLSVLFSNGAEKSYSFQVAGHTATPTNDRLYVDGRLQTPSIYKIDGSNYFKIRDIAALLNGTGKQFEVGYDAATGSVTVTTGQPYTANGTELTGPAAGGSKAAAPTSDAIYVNGAKQNLTVYKIDGSNYFKLRDLGQVLDFYVGYDAATGVTLSGSSGYTA